MHRQAEHTDRQDPEVDTTLEQADPQANRARRQAGPQVERPLK
jgi:hypothetical protein